LVGATTRTLQLKLQGITQGIVNVASPAQMIDRVTSLHSWNLIAGNNRKGFAGLVASQTKVANLVGSKLDLVAIRWSWCWRLRDTLNLSLTIATGIAMQGLQIFAHGTASLGVVCWIEHDGIDFATCQATIVDKEIPTFNQGCGTSVTETTKPAADFLTSYSMTTKAQECGA
jgi:hypothetical protein